MMGSVELIVMLLMVTLNSVFAAYEIALAAVSAARLQVLVRESHRGAWAALYMKENIEGSLAAIQLGITLFGAVAAATGGAAAEEQIAPWLQNRFGLTPGWAELLAVSIVVVPLTAITIMFGELVPKVFALRNKEWACLTLSPTMRWFTLSAWPVVWLLETSVSAIADWGQQRFACAEKLDAGEIQELQAVASLARTLRLIGHREEGIIIGAARLSSRPIKEIMLPAASISMLHVDASLADALVATHLDMHTRFPVTETSGDAQGIVGYANVKDVVAVMRLSPQANSVRAVLRPLPSFSEADTIATCLERSHGPSSGWRGQHLRHGYAGGHYRGTAGRHQRRIRPPTDLCDGIRDCVGGGRRHRIDLTRLREVTGIDLREEAPSAKNKVLSDWVANQLGRPVRGGDVVEHDGVRVAVRKVRRQQVLEAQVAATAGRTNPHPSGSPEP